MIGTIECRTLANASLVYEWNSGVGWCGAGGREAAWTERATGLAARPSRVWRKLTYMQRHARVTYKYITYLRSNERLCLHAWMITYIPIYIVRRCIHRDGTRARQLTKLPRAADGWDHKQNMFWPLNANTRCKCCPNELRTVDQKEISQLFKLVDFLFLALLFNDAVSKEIIYRRSNEFGIWRNEIRL
jgi:hypothetical protein